MIAHRAGNDLRRLRALDLERIAIVEADVHLFRGRLEVRHLKTFGPVPVYWDRWRLPWRFSPRLLLPDLLEALPPSVSLLLDLKGRSRRLAPEVLRTLGDRGALACSRHWRHLDAFAGAPGIRIVHSVGSRRQLSALLRRSRAEPIDGVSIHERLLDAETAAALRRHAQLVMSWPVNTVERARELASWGVQGLITDIPTRIQPLAAT